MLQFQVADVELARYFLLTPKTISKRYIKFYYTALPDVQGDVIFKNSF